MRTRRRFAVLTAGVALVATAVIVGTPRRAAALVLPPGTPVGLSVTADDAAVYVSWSAPSSDGGAPIDSYQVQANSSTTVFAPCAQCTSVYFSGLTNGTSYTFSVAAHNSAGYSVVPATSGSVKPVASTQHQDSAPTNVAATVSGQSATVTWQPPTNSNGLPIDRYLIQANDRTLTNSPGAVYYAGWKYACGTCQTVTFDGLTAGDTYDFSVYAHNQSTVDVYGVSARSNTVVPTSSCTTGTICLGIDGTSDEGPLAWRAAGLLHGLSFTSSTQGGTTTYTYGGPSPDLIHALNPTAWRVGSCVAPQQYFPECQWATTNTTAQLTDVLSDDYYTKTYSSQIGGMRPPWECWACYAADITAIIKSTGPHNVAPPQYDQALPPTSVYWDLQNEPGSKLGPNQSGTTALYLHQLQQAYNSIRAIDPTIKMVMPSLGGATDTPIEAGGLNDPHILGFDSFLPFAVANRMSVDALSWHANSGLYEDSPSVLPYQVAQIQYLESEYAMSPTPKMFVNEYGAQFANLLPGWSAGWIAALEGARVDAADRACWNEHAGVLENGTSYSECGAGSVDGLFTSQYDPNPYQPDANYWVYRYYAQMAGDVIGTTTTDNTLTALATRDDATSTLDVLVGRHESCTPAVNPADCTTALAPEVASIPTPASAPVGITINYPYSATTVSAVVTEIPNQRGAVSEPSGQQQIVPVTNGVVSVTLPAVADGEAYTVTLTPNS